MSEFDIMFAMFGLLIGLAIAEVLGGFARIIKMRRRARIGWLTPLLGTVVLLDLNSFWITAWTMRDVVSINLGTQTLVLLVVGGYYLVSTLIFPDDPEDWPDFDAYYDKHNRIVLGGVIAINLALLAMAMVIAADPAIAAKVLGPDAPASRPDGLLETSAELLATLSLPLLVAVWFIKNRRINGALLALIVLGTVLQGAAALV